MCSELAGRFFFAFLISISFRLYRRRCALSGEARLHFFRHGPFLTGIHSFDVSARITFTTALLRHRLLPALVPSFPYSTDIDHKLKSMNLLQLYTHQPRKILPL